MLQRSSENLYVSFVQLEKNIHIMYSQYILIIWLAQFTNENMYTFVDYHANKGMDGLTDIEGVYLDFNNSITKIQ